MVTSPGSWNGAVAAVTGAAGGIGAAIASLGASEGGEIWILDVDDSQGEILAESFGSGSRVRYQHMDVTEPDSVQAAFARIDELCGGVDILVNNAGKDANFSPTAMTTADWDAVMNLDLRASWLTARAVLPGMIHRGSGSIVNVASLHATLTAEGNFPYGAAKAGLAGLTRSLALEVGPHGIRVNTVSPGYTLSERVEAHLAELGEEETRRIRDLHALRSFASCDDVAEVVVFLASDRARFVTGANWAVDGGLGARYA